MRAAGDETTVMFSKATSSSSRISLWLLSMTLSVLVEDEEKRKQISKNDNIV